MGTGKIGPAFAASCTITVKHAEDTPLTMLLLGKVFRRRRPARPRAIGPAGIPCFRAHRPHRTYLIFEPRAANLCQLDVRAVAWMHILGTRDRGAVKPQFGDPHICSRGYNEAIGLTTADNVTYYVSDLGGAIRVISLADGTDRKVVNLGPGLTG